MPSSPAVSVSVAQVRDLHDPARRAGDRVPDLGHAEHRERCSCRASPGASTIWSARAIASSASGLAGGSAGTSSTSRMRSRCRPCCDRDLARRPARRRRRPSSRPGPSVAGSTRPTAPSRRPASSSAAVEIAERLREADEHQVAERVAGELAGRKRCSNAAGPRAVVARERDEAPAEIAGRGDVEVAAQPAGASRRRRRR